MKVCKNSFLSTSFYEELKQHSWTLNRSIIMLLCSVYPIDILKLPKVLFSKIQTLKEITQLP
jgi:hypothetical protein